MHCSLGFFFRSLIWLFSLLLPGLVRSQTCIPTNLNGKNYNINCEQACIPFNFQVPDMRSTSDYDVLTVPYTPYPYLDPAAQESAAIYDDDVFGDVVNLPFPFCFYDSVFTKLAVGSNGLVTFDISNANCSNAYTVDPKIPYSGGSPCDVVETYYPRASIMGAYSDLDPRIPASLRDRKVEWFTVGTAPCRKFIISYYHIGTWSAAGACDPFWNTFQIVLHESTGIVEIFLEQKSLCTMSSNLGKGIIGMQNWNRNKAVTAPARNATQFKETRVGYRFVPTAGLSRFLGAELYAMDGTSLAIADTGRTKPGLLDLHFPSVCPPQVNSSSLVLKTRYNSCSDPLGVLEADDTINIYRRMNISMQQGTTICEGGKSGSLTLTVQGNSGQSPFSFMLDSQAPVNGTSPVTFYNLAAGNHTINVTDANGCSGQTNLAFEVLDGPPITTTVDKTDLLCNGSGSGVITVKQPTVGIPPFEYSIDGTNWQLSPVFSNLAPGNYTIGYRDSSGCSGTQAIDITEPEPLLIDLSKTDATCTGANTGSIQVSASGGVEPYQFSVDGNNWQDGKTFSVIAGNYTVSVRDQNNCITAQPVTINQPAGVNLSAVTVNGGCGNIKDGKITITAAGGTMPYTYSVDGVTYQPSNVFNVNPGTYVVNVIDNSGCKFSTDAVVGYNNDLTIVKQKDTAVCEGSFVQLAVQSAATAYQWTPSAGLSNASIYNPKANPVIPTTYIVKASLGPCDISDTVLVDVRPAPVPDAGPDGFICFGQSYNLLGSGGTQYQWTPAAGLDNAAIADPVSTAALTTAYSLSVVDAAGCRSIITDEMIVDVTPPINVINSPTDTIGYMGDQFQLSASSEGNIYSWSPATGLDDPGIQNPTVTLGAIGTDIIYKVTATTRAGCKGEGLVRVRVYSGPEIYVPSAFTPNDDGRNDRFIPIPVGISKLNYFRVFNRTGQQLFSTVTFMQGWDGKYLGEKQPVGVYVWMIQALTKDNRVISRKGTVTLIR